VTDAPPEAGQPTDAELVERCRAGDDAAWAALVERYSRYVYAIAGRGFRLADHDAEDVFQDVFLRVYQRLDSVRDPGSLRPWIGQVTRRLCLDRLAAAKGEPDSGDPDETESDGSLAEIESAMDVRDALRTLDERCRELLDRFFARDEPYRVIADELDLPMGTVASRISRCLDKLRDVLGEDDGRKEPGPASGRTSR
jgi:RNA polymerase sigma factor (sigma-70 family)